jgi:hypothetical protein
MSVIGRLDEQVDRILISPLKKRDWQKPAPATAHDERANDQAESSNHTRPTASSDNQPATDEPRARDQLPVWLL